MAASLGWRLARPTSTSLSCVGKLIPVVTRSSTGMAGAFAQIRAERLGADVDVEPEPTAPLIPAALHA